MISGGSRAPCCSNTRPSGPGTGRKPGWSGQGSSEPPARLTGRVTDPVLKVLERQGKGGVFFLSGEDAFRRDQAARALVDAHVDPSTRDFNLDLLRGSDLEVDRLASILATPPMMAEWRVVEVREVETLSSSSRFRDLLLETARKPPPGLALVLVAGTTTAARFWKDLKQAATSAEFGAVTDDEVPAWLMERARDTLGVEMDEAAARALGAAVGTDLGVLARELDKLRDYVQEGGPITRADVEAAGTRLPRQDRWQWFEMVGERRFDEALEGLPVLLGQGESGVGLVIGLSTQLLRLGVARTRGPDALAEVLEPRMRWLARKIAPQARRWSPEELDQAVMGLLRADRLLKSSGVSDEAILEEWLLGLIVRARAAA
jgi:DNA polymerase III subunit delta